MKKTPLNKKIGHCLIYIFLFIFLLLLFAYLWGINNFGNITMDEIVFTLSMSLEGASRESVISYLMTGFLPAVLIFVLIWSMFHVSGHTYEYAFVIRTEKKERTIRLAPLHFHGLIWFAALLVAFILLVLLINYSFSLTDFIQNQINRSTFIEEEYVDPNSVTLTFPDNKRNLIWVCMESAETSAQDVQSGGLMDVNYIPEMTQLAKDNISFSTGDLIEGAITAPSCTWTAAGLVAQTSGLPLKMYSYKTADGKNTDNTMTNFELFLPGATSTGQILESNGYRNYFMAGSDFTFGGRRNYFTQHGDYEIFDYLWAKEEGKIDPEYNEWWGFEDVKLYEFAKEKLLEISQSDEPFNFCILTADTHTPDGYWCELCEDEWGDQYGDVWSCASRQIEDFVSWVQQQDFYENTTIIVTGDHCSMNKDFYGEYSQNRHAAHTTRRVYNVFINSDPSVTDSIDETIEKNRKFTTMDIFPTMLASIGVQMEGDRIALGTNLFSGKKTLAEEFGYKQMFSEMKKKSTFYNQELMFP